MKMILKYIKGRNIGTFGGFDENPPNQIPPN